ncbi:TolC family outer membrane protein [Pectobacterium brasiliense]|uniref:Channel protein TolC n=1 Tax=Pectobacterium brasiliense TaxID=180957 RepID=A0A0M2EVW9_9GAMM|nr:MULTISPECIES: TolC family outer membrane protein [Pectobacterium]KGA22166.1 channel protein TolC [Pectobacterium brasiliense]KGA31599.1 channel protein TolC [Pectobacterium brasiliense]KMK81076.1 TolC family type I secretion outer membrane protein [Pectobacterium brasiliense ICMP 19477]KRF63895.1 channel protein TolC [Pectobacterium brasiliense]MBN3187667.1 TolC family outer membrane protein [Pectobacterium brasiliense]
MMRRYYFALLPFITLFSTATHAETIQEAIKSTLYTHPEVSAAINSRFSAEHDLRAAKGGYLPSITLSAGVGREETDSPSTRASTNKRVELSRQESSINLSQTVFDGFATSSEVGRQRATVNSRAYKVLNTSEATALDTVQVYLSVLQRQEFVRLAEANLASHERIYDQIRLRSEQGVGRLADLDQAEARLAQARNNALTEQTNLDDAKINYMSIVGKVPENLVMPDASAIKIPASLDEALRIMLANSPALKSAESDIEATQQQYETSKSTFYPRLNVELSRTMDNNVDGTRGQNNEWQAMLRMRYNLYEGGSSKANMESKAYQVKEAQDVRNNALRLLSEELKLAWSALNNSRQQLPIAAEYADRSMKVRTAYQKQFGLGERTLLDLLDSENELFTAQRRLVEVRFTSLYTEYRIASRMGELLNRLAIPAPDAGTSLTNVTTQAELPSLN